MSISKKYYILFFLTKRKINKKNIIYVIGQIFNIYGINKCFIIMNYVLLIVNNF